MKSFYITSIMTNEKKHDILSITKGLYTNSIRTRPTEKHVLLQTVHPLKVYLP